MPPILKNIILIVVLVVVLFVAIMYIVRQKKRGIRCIGCPHAGSCSKCCGSVPSKTEHNQDKPVQCNGNCSQCSSCSSVKSDS